MPRQSLRSRIPAIVRSVEIVEVAVALVVTPSGVLLIQARAPTLDPFERIDPSTDDLWVRLATDRVHGERHPRIEFMTRRKPYTTDTRPRRIARSARGRRPERRNVRVACGSDGGRSRDRPPDPSGDDARNDPLHLFAFVRTTVLRLEQVSGTVRAIRGRNEEVGTTGQRCRQLPTKAMIDMGNRAEVSAVRARSRGFRRRRIGRYRACSSRAATHRRRCSAFRGALR